MFNVYCLINGQISMKFLSDYLAFGEDSEKYLINTTASVDAISDLYTRYPLLLGGQRKSGFKVCPMVFSRVWRYSSRTQHGS